MKGGPGREEDEEGAGKAKGCRWGIGGAKGREMKKDFFFNGKEKRQEKSEQGAKGDRKS